MAIEYRTCLYCGKEWRTGSMDLNRYCSTGCWADALDDIPKPNQVQAPTVEGDCHECYYSTTSLDFPN